MRFRLHIGARPARTKRTALFFARLWSTVCDGVSVVAHCPARAESGRAFAASSAGRGAEFSALEVFNGKMLTFCDRTGKIFELKAELSESKSGWVPAKVGIDTVKEGNGNEIVIKGGDGSVGMKPFKTEW